VSVGRDARRAARLAEATALRGARAHAAIALLAALLAAGCAVTPAVSPAPALRIRDVAGQGDEARRASLRLVLDGLRADSAHDTERARGLYQRALQVDSGNPYAYLALARQSVESEEPDLALEYVDRAEDLFDAEGARTPGVDADLDGLRGAALVLTGDADRGAALLDLAALHAPEVWSDRRLDADELR
jgi:hypothetical protein